MNPKDYSTDELYEALESVDGARFPERKAELESELQVRRDSGRLEEEEKQRREERAASEAGLRSFIAWYQLVSSLIFAGVVLLSLFASGFGPGSILAGAITIILGGLSFMAGMRLRKNVLSGYYLTFLSLGLQVVSLTSAVFTWNYTALARFSFYIGEPFAFGFNFLLSPSFYMSFNVGDPLRASFDILTLAMIVLLFGSGEYSKAKKANKALKQDALKRAA